MNEKIYISGMHSGQSPCAGLSIARSIRKAFPHVKIIGVDHWQGSSGLHDLAVDDYVLLPQWNQIKTSAHVEFIRSLLDAGNIWLPALDVEIRWLSENLGEHRGLLAPNRNALRLTEKPAVQAMQALGFRVAESIPAALPDAEVHAFLRQHAWQCWLKSPYHDARRIPSWATFERLRKTLARNWRTSRLFVQRHVIGSEESIAFAAHQGRLLGAVHMEKYLLTSEGKTWAGKVTPCRGHFFEHFQAVIAELNWSGGGEIEYMHDPDGNKWIIECNPRFPAWIFGAALAGANLPAKLVSHLWGVPFLESRAQFPFFTRVVHEVPVKESIGIPRPKAPGAAVWTSDGKGSKDGVQSADLLPELEDSEEEETRIEVPHPPAPFAAEVSQLTESFDGETPARVLLESWSELRFEKLAKKIQDRDVGYPKLKIGYSVKTSPTDAHLRMAKRYGFHAECISQMEVRRSIEAGFARNQIILNGPGKFWPTTQPPIMGLHMLFCDSLEEFRRVSRIPKIASCLGLRIRIPKLDSRFGNALDDFERFQQIVRSVGELDARSELGFHFHMPSWSIGLQRWNEALHALLAWCKNIEQLASRPIQRIDLGGGFFPSDLEDFDFKSVQALIHSELPNVSTVYFEPGRALTQESEALITRILDIRRQPDEAVTEVVVDGCIAELPLAMAYPHRVFYQTRDKNIPGSACAFLQRGSARILGRICMEDDILAQHVDIPKTAQIGDLVIFGDAGGYERSMSYAFGRG